jgi:hypothetical protein
MADNAIALFPEANGAENSADTSDPVTGRIDLGEQDIDR